MNKGNDLKIIQSMSPVVSHIHTMSSVDELLKRDEQREQDGFPRKIRVGRLVKPGKKGKIVVVPTTVEEKFIHDRNPQQESSSGGTGDGQEGEVIGEEPIHGTPGSGTGGAGQGEGGEHEIEASAYELGRTLTEKFKLPHLKDKGKKRSVAKYTYDLTDRHEGTGQLLDKKGTLRKIVETNISLGNIPDVNNIDPSRFLVAPDDKIYRVLSKEKDFESQALVFFIRDYSGSMSGKPTEIVASQHLMIYSWLLFQYDKRVETRFILHDTAAKEVDDFNAYYNSNVAGGTRISSAFKLVNELVEKDSLYRDYNIYVFHGTDGDDWDTHGGETLPEIKKMLAYCNRLGITITSRIGGNFSGTAYEGYLRDSKILSDFPKEIRLDVIPESADEPRIIKGIKRLIMPA